MSVFLRLAVADFVVSSSRGLVGVHPCVTIGS